MAVNAGGAMCAIVPHRRLTPGREQAMKPRPARQRSGPTSIDSGPTVTRPAYAGLQDARWYGVRESEADIALDIDESEDAYFVRADLPGARREDIDVSIDEATLTIRASVNAVEVELHDVSPVVRERWQGRRSRRVLLDSAVDAGHATARLVDGVLELRLPKKAGGRGRRVRIE